MKHFPLFALALLLHACAVVPTLDPQAARQHQLEKEARENFIAMKAQEHPGRPVVLHDDTPVATPAPHLTAFQSQQQPAPTPYLAARPTPHFIPTPLTRAPRKNDDTVFYWQVPSPGERTSPREQAAEAKYARSLAKRPENLTPEERLWAHEHF